MASPTLRHAVHENGVALIEFDRPKKRNALSQSMIDELVSTLKLLDQDSRVRAVCLTGSPNGPFSGDIHVHPDGQGWHMAHS
jgi:enoyl-CoA hydratase